MNDGTLFDWAGSYLVDETVIARRRWVLDTAGTLAPCRYDLRRWITPPGDDEMQRVWTRIARRHEAYLSVVPPDEREDARAKAVWHFVVERVRFVVEPADSDFWHLPEETLALGYGDCEDKTFLAVSLLLAAGIDRSRVRVTIGALDYAQPRDGQHLLGHAWPSYRDRRGVWRVLETNIRHLPVLCRAHDGRAIVRPSRRSAPIDACRFLSADRLAAAGRACRYLPVLCCDDQHVWAVRETVPGSVPGALSVHRTDGARPTFRELWRWEQRLAQWVAEACAHEVELGE